MLTALLWILAAVPPIWVPADAVVDESVPPCKLFKMELPRHFADGKMGTSLEALNRDAIAIYEGTIVEIRSGFFARQPASLLVVAVDEELRSSAEYDATRGLYVYYPIADFVVGDTRFCSRALYNDYAPRPGDAVIVYAMHGPADEGRQTVYAESRDLFFQSADRFIAPRSLRFDPAVAGLRTLTDLREVVRRGSVRATTTIENE